MTCGVIDVEHIFIFQLVSDNYTETGCSDASPAVPQPTKIPENVSSDASSVPDSMKREMEELQQQLQLLKKQTMTALDQARKSSDREQTALLQAHESLKLEGAATAKATCSAERENYILDLMTDASQDMAGTLPFSLQTKLPFLVQPLTMFFFFVIGSFLDTAAEEQRVNLRVGSLMRLAKKANVDFWADETRCRRIVQFQDRATQT